MESSNNTPSKKTSPKTIIIPVLIKVTLYTAGMVIVWIVSELIWGKNPPDVVMIPVVVLGVGIIVHLCGGVIELLKLIE